MTYFLAILLRPSYALFSVQQIMISDLSPWLIRLFAFAFGATWGSFFNVAIHRWPRGMSVVTPGSHCPACQSPIPSYRNIPIISYILLRGKSACCGSRITPRYVLIEIISAVLCVAVVERYFIGSAPSTTLIDALMLSVCYFTFVGGLLVATFVDLEFMEIPDEVTLPITALGLVTAAFRESPGIEAIAIGAGGSYLLVQLIFVWSYERLTGRRGMGEGDSKLLMMIGSFIGYKGALFSIMAGAAQGLLVVLVGFAIGKHISSGQPDVNASTDSSPDEQGMTASIDESEPPPKYIGHLKIPFGPFLALSALEYLFFGDFLFEKYLSLF